MANPVNEPRPETSIARVQVTDVDSGETFDLHTKEGSTCHFFERFEAGDYLIQLRLHWRDRDEKGHPKLKADFIDPATGKHDHSMDRDPAHHTTSADCEERTYVWEFADVAKRFTVAVTWSLSASATGSAHLTASPASLCVKESENATAGSEATSS